MKISTTEAKIPFFFSSFRENPAIHFFFCSAGARSPSNALSSCAGEPPGRRRLRFKLFGDGARTDPGPSGPGTMRRSRMSIQLMGAVGAVSLVTIGIFAWVSITTQRDQFVDETIRSASQFSDT